MIALKPGDIVLVDGVAPRHKILNVGEGLAQLTQLGANPRVDWSGVAVDRLTVVVRL